MNMSDRKRLYIILLSGIFFLLTSSWVLAQEKDSTKAKGAGEYSLVLYAGGGLSVYASSPGVPEYLETTETTTGLCGSVRVMWHPDHLLRLGIESGSVPFYSYTMKDTNYSGELNLSAVPLLLEWSMPVGDRFNIFLGYGIYFLKTKLDYAGATESSTRSIGLAVAVSYVHPLSENLGIAGEVKWMNATETKNKVFLTQILLAWKFHKW
jgi:Outer membrane protein beta-barrel domain